MVLEMRVSLERKIIMMKWKLFCTVTMKSYEVEAESEFNAREKLASELNVPLSCIDVFI